MMIEPAPWACITWLARWDTCSGAMRLSSTIFWWRSGEVVVASVYGVPPALFTTTSRRPVASTAAEMSRSTWAGSRTSAATNVAARPSAATGAGGRLRARQQEPAGDPRADAPRAAGDEHRGPADLVVSHRVP